MAELPKEINGVIGDRPITPSELQDAKDRQTRAMAGEFETGRSVEEAVAKCHVTHYSFKGTEPRGRPRKFEMRLGDAEAAQSTARASRRETPIVGSSLDPALL